MLMRHTTAAAKFNLILYAGCLGLSPVYVSENSLYKCVSQPKIAKKIT